MFSVKEKLESRGVVGVRTPLGVGEDDAIDMALFPTATNFTFKYDILMREWLSTDRKNRSRLNEA